MYLSKSTSRYFPVIFETTGRLNGDEVFVHVKYCIGGQPAVGDEVTFDIESFGWDPEDPKANHLGCKKNHVNNRISYLPQLVSRISSNSTRLNDFKRNLFSQGIVSNEN